MPRARLAGSLHSAAVFPFPVSAPVNPAGWAHLVYFGLVIPFAAWRAKRRLIDKAAPPVDRLKHLQAGTFSLLVFAGMSLVIARVQDIALFPLVGPTLPALAAGVAFYIAAVWYMRPRWRRAVERRARVVHLFMPSNASERFWWIAMSVFAGVGEEITWRGVQTPLLAAGLGNVWIAALLSALLFGAAHLIQGWRSCAVIVVFALAFQSIVWLAGSLYVAMVVHVVYDITAGLTYGKLGRELGYSLEPAAQAATD